MRLILLSLLLGFSLPSKSNQEFIYQYPIVCVETAVVLKVITEEFNETLTWTAEQSQDKSVFSLWSNIKTGSWTMLKMSPTFSCVLGSGEKSKIRLGDPA